MLPVVQLMLPSALPPTLTMTNQMESATIGHPGAVAWSAPQAPMLGSTNDRRMASLSSQLLSCLALPHLNLAPPQLKVGPSTILIPGQLVRPNVAKWFLPSWKLFSKLLRLMCFICCILYISPLCHIEFELTSLYVQPPEVAVDAEDPGPGSIHIHAHQLLHLYQQLFQYKLVHWVTLSGMPNDNVLQCQNQKSSLSAQPSTSCLALLQIFLGSKVYISCHNCNFFFWQVVAVLCFKFWQDFQISNIIYTLSAAFGPCI